MRRSMKGGKMRIVAGLAMTIAAGVCLVTFAEPSHCRSEQPALLINWEFSKPNPPTIKVAKLYVWCTPTVIRWGEKISLYIEYVAQEKTWFTPVSPIRLTVEDPTYLLIKRGKWTVLLRDGSPPSEDTIPPRLSRDEWLPKEHEVPYWRLHGQRLVFPDEEDFVHMQPGDSFVRRIPDLTALFRTKKTPDGRVWVLCIRYIRRGRDSYEGIIEWLPIEGRYRLQWAYSSNIIEFEIRQ